MAVSRRGAALIIFGCVLFAADVHPASQSAEYRTQFRLDIQPGEDSARGAIRVLQPDSRLKRLRLIMPAATFSAVKADGELTRSGDEVTWEVPARGGELRYRVVVTHERDGGGYDALVTDHNALFRADRVFPRARAVHKPGARGRGELVLVLPSGWSSITPYLPDPSGRLTFVNLQRSFPRPVGWVLAGRIGSRMDVIGETMVRIAAPRGRTVQRVPMLALIRSVLPVLQAELPAMPRYLLVVTAGDPMWRGGLSAPNSVYVHADRPLLSENGTSALVHELIHLLAPVPAAPDQDWIDEGLAEYLGLLVLRESDAISPERFAHAIDVFRRRGKRVRSIVTTNASGVVTARAVAIFDDLDRELRRRSSGRTDIFDLVRRLMQEPEPVDVERLRSLASELAAGQPVQALSAANLPGTR